MLWIRRKGHVGNVAVAKLDKERIHIVTGLARVEFRASGYGQLGPNLHRISQDPNGDAHYDRDRYYSACIFTLEKKFYDARQKSEDLWPEDNVFVTVPRTRMTFIVYPRL